MYCTTGFLSCTYKVGQPYNWLRLVVKCSFVHKHKAFACRALNWYKSIRTQEVDRHNPLVCGWYGIDNEAE